MITNERSITYAELDQAVEGMARHLADRGLRNGDRLAVHWPNSVEGLVMMLGAWRAGLVVVPINPRLKAPEISYILEHSGARLCFSEPALAPLVQGVEVISELPAATGNGVLLPDVGPDAPALIVYTSGTTALPKGVVHSQRGLFEGARGCILYGIDCNVRALAVTQITHSAALVGICLPCLIEGASAVLLRIFDAGAALDAIERHRCTNCFVLPALLQLIAQEQAEHPRNVSSLRKIWVGGDSVPVMLQRQVWELFDVEVLEVYGMTEVLPIAGNPLGAVRPGSLGLPLSSTVRIVDLQGRDVEADVAGEMLVRSPANCVGYWNDPKATAHLLEGGWLRTGDLGSRGEDGYLWFRGRLKQIIIRGGSNISPQEVEEALYQHPDVFEAGVVGLPDPKFAEVPVAFV